MEILQQVISSPFINIDLNLKEDKAKGTKREFENLIIDFHDRMLKIKGIENKFDEKNGSDKDVIL